MISQRFLVVLLVEVGIAQLTEDRGEHSLIVGAAVQGGFELGDTFVELVRLAQALAFQGQLQALAAVEIFLQFGHLVLLIGEGEENTIRVMRFNSLGKGSASSVESKAGNRLAMNLTFHRECVLNDGVSNESPKLHSDHNLSLLFAYLIFKLIAQKSDQTGSEAHR